jgi:hypothetical protein
MEVVHIVSKGNHSFVKPVVARPMVSDEHHSTQAIFVDGSTYCPHRRLSLGSRTADELLNSTAKELPAVPRLARFDIMLGTTGEFKTIANKVSFSACTQATRRNQALSCPRLRRGL